MVGFDLLSTVESGGCSSKISASELEEALSGLPRLTHENLLVDIDTHDDAGVYKLTDDIAIIQTTDFFPPICSDPYEFGQVAAANSLSDVYAMGGEVISALNLVMFPSEKIPMEVLKEILRGGIDKVKEAGGVIAGGHTINDDPPKYGLAVTGIVHPQRIITNSGVRPGEVMILTKPLGMGIIVSGKKIDSVSIDDYNKAVSYMKMLNKDGAKIMQKYDVRGATDITGFGLFGHALKMAEGSGVTIEIETSKLPLLASAYELADIGCLPCGVFNNQKFIENRVDKEENVDFNRFLIGCDAQTSGGLLMSIKEEYVDDALEDLKKHGYTESAVIGRVLEKDSKGLKII